MNSTTWLAAVRASPPAVAPGAIATSQMAAAVMRKAMA